MDYINWNDPYDPDMTVSEALNAGLIAIIDTGTIGAGPYERCDYGSPFKHATGDRDPGVLRCTRNAGHPGLHAIVVRWEYSRADVEEDRRLARKHAKENEVARRAAAVKNRERAESAQAAAAQFAERLGVMGTAIEKSMASALEASLHRVESQAYSPMEGHRKNARFRDQRAGKVRGK